MHLEQLNMQQKRGGALKDLMEETTWDASQLAGFIVEHREELGFGSTDATELTSLYEHCAAESAMLPVQDCVELAFHFGKESAEFYVGLMEGEEAELEKAEDAFSRAKKAETLVSPQKPAGAEKSIKELRSEALKRALQESGKTLSGVAKEVYPDDKKAQKNLALKISRCANAKTTMGDETIKLIAPVLGVSESTLKVRELSGKEWRMAARGSKAKTVASSSPATGGESTRELRSEAFKGALEAAGESQSGLAKKVHPGDAKAQKNLAQKLNRVANMKATLSDETIALIAPVLGVTQKSLKVCELEPGGSRKKAVKKKFVAKRKRRAKKVVGRKAGIGPIVTAQGTLRLTSEEIGRIFSPEGVTAEFVIKNGDISLILPLGEKEVPLTLPTERFFAEVGG